MSISWCHQIFEFSKFLINYLIINYRSVDTFSKPALPPPIMTPRRAPRPPARTPASASATTRRNSARMGVAGSRPPLHTCAGGGTPSSGVATRRQTLTGIRTGIRTSTALSPATPAEASKRVAPPPKRPTAEKPNVPLTDEPIYGNIESVNVRKAKPLPRTPVFNGEKSQDSLRITRRSNTPRYIFICDNYMWIHIAYQQCLKFLPSHGKIWPKAGIRIEGVQRSEDIFILFQVQQTNCFLHLEITWNMLFYSCCYLKSRPCARL